MYVIFYYNCFVGDVVLRDLKLKETCLDSLDLPVRTIYGHLGKFK